MKRKASDEPISVPPPILTIPEELFIPIMSFVDPKSHLAFACTCKTLYNYYKQNYTEQTFTLVCDPQCKRYVWKFEPRYEGYLEPQHVKALERRMSQIGWVRVKVTLKIALLNVQDSYEHPIKALYLKAPFKMVNGLDCASLNALIMEFPFSKELVEPNLSCEKFSNLKSLQLKYGAFDDGIVSMLAKIPSLEFISLYCCSITRDCISKIFKDCTTLQEIHLVYSGSSFDSIPIKLSPQLKRFKITGDLKNLTQT